LLKTRILNIIVVVIRIWKLLKWGSTAIVIIIIRNLILIAIVKTKFIIKIASLITRKLILIIKIIIINIIIIIIIIIIIVKIRIRIRIRIRIITRIRTWDCISIKLRIKLILKIVIRLV